VHWHKVRPSAAETRLLDALASFERTVLREAGRERRDAALLLLTVFRKRALSTTRALEISLRRRLNWIETSRSGDVDAVQGRLTFDYEGDESGTEEAALSADIGCPAARERTWIGRLLALALAAGRDQSKARAVLTLLRRSREPAIVFTEFRHSLEVIAGAAATLRRVAVLHGGQSSTERRDELDRFLRHDATVLVATDVAGQGLNLQTASRRVINVELPWNPARLEQRIGRVDRIGQTRRPHFTLLVAAHPAEASVLQRLARRTLTAQHSLGPGVLGDVVPPAESAIAATLLEGSREVVPLTSGEPVAISRTWHRHARACARQIVQGRWLASRWRAVDDGTPIWSSMTKLPRVAALGRGVLLIFAVPIVDGAGRHVERRIVAVRLPRSVRWRDPQVLLRASMAARTSLESRCRRLVRLSARHADAAITVERAIVADLDSRESPGGVQTGLFSQASMRAFVDAERRTQDRNVALRRHVADLTLGTRVEVGTPRLEVVFLPR
jgi:hypothetical protein